MITPFESHIKGLPPSQRSIQTEAGRWNTPRGQVYFGIPPCEDFGRTLLTKAPEDSHNFHFLMGPAGLPSLLAFLNSDFPKRVTRITIGNSSYVSGKGQDYRAMVKAMSQVTFPELTHLELGVWELYCNAHRLFGQLGNLTPLLKRLPKLESLDLYGHFEMTEPHDFQSLTSLSLEQEDPTTGGAEESITQTTLDHLLNGNYPKLKTCQLDLTWENNPTAYGLPEPFLSGQNLPRLEQLGIDGPFAPETAQAFKASPLKTRLGQQALLANVPPEPA